MSERIRTYVHDPETGAIMCPHCDLEMARCVDFPPRAAFDCGNGHWIAASDVYAGAA